MNWPVELLDGLVAEGFRVVRYDNRDVGLSQKFPERGIPLAAEVAKAVRAGETPEVPYRIEEMAADGIGVLDALGIDHAHVAGVSMGGMLVQHMAFGHPSRVASMTSIMSTSSDPGLPQATGPAMEALTSVPASDSREDVIAHTIKGRRTFESPAWPRTDAELAETIGEAYDRMYYPEGNARQHAAILSDGSRVERLKTIAVPSLVIHGDSDTLIPVEGGHDTAKHIPGARLEIIEGMGHDLPPEICPRLVELIVTHARTADCRQAAE